MNNGWRVLLALTLAESDYWKLQNFYKNKSRFFVRFTNFEE